MSITVERLYRVTIGDTALVLDGEQVHRLAMDLLTVLGNETDRTAASVRATPELAPGPLSLAPQSAEPEPNASRTARFAGTPWQPADTERLRVLAGEGKTGPQIAALMGKPRGTIGAQAHKHQIALGGGKRGARGAGLPEIAASPEAPPSPAAITPTAVAVREPSASVAAPATPRVVTIQEADPLADQVRTGPLREWTAADTSRLIHIMAPATTKAEIEEAATEAARELSRTVMSCKNRWGHLKGAGRMTIARYLSDPESLPNTESEVA